MHLCVQAVVFCGGEAGAAVGGRTTARIMTGATLFRTAGKTARTTGMATSPPSIARQVTAMARTCDQRRVLSAS